MIYFTVGDQSVVLLEPGNINRLKKGDAAHTPDKKILIAYTPDAVKFTEELQRRNIVNINTGEFDVERMDGLLRESLDWPEVQTRPYEPLKQIIRRQ